MSQQQPHVAAALDLLAGLTGYVSEAPAGAVKPYYVLHPAMPLRAGETLDGVRSFKGHDFQTTCVGTTTEQAQFLAAKVAERLEDARPVIAGQQTGFIRKEYSQPAQADRDVTPTVFYAVDGWSFTSV